MGLRTRLVLASALVLFVELSLIRWLGANIVHLAYFSNFVLLGSFLGVGLGFLRAARPDQPAGGPQPYYSLIVLLGLIGFVSAYPVTVDRSSTQVVFFTNIGASGPPIWVVLPGVFLAVAAITAGGAEIVGSCFRSLPRLAAYRFDLLGSLAGIVSFTALSYIGSPPLLWFGVVAVLFAVLLGRRAVGITVTVSIALTTLLLYPLRHDTGDFWSPYYKVSTAAVADAGGISYTVSVNGVPHQRLTSAATRAAEEPYYLRPYRTITANAGRVLIIGAGTGTDVAIALAQGATHVDAVEIDPTLQRFGAQHDPDHAYQDPRVTVHINDGRAFLQQSTARYDLILFALPDSLTLVSGASSLRLESYLFTLQAAQSARRHLAPGGGFAMYNFYREQWIVDRLAGTLDDAFGHSPCVFAVPQVTALAVLSVGLSTADQHCDGTTWHRPADTPPPATDDRPFVYLRNPGVPGLYRVTLLMIVLASIAAVGLVLGLNAAAAGRRGLGRRLCLQVREMWSYRDLFLLGVAFLLLETRSVTGFALLFGTTWLVNAFVFAGVLLAVLAAVELTARLRTPPAPVMYAALLGSLALGWAVPSSWLLGLDVWLRAPVAVLIAALPIFCANVIFAQRFADTDDAPTAFGTNLLGAIIGGCLEYSSLEFGYRALLIIAGIVYLTAFLVRPRVRGHSLPVTPVTDMVGTPG